MYYNYHAIIKKRIANGEIISAKMLEKYNKISPCLLLIFDDKVYPIREHMFAEYLDILRSHNVKIDNKL